MSRSARLLFAPRCLRTLACGVALAPVLMARASAQDPPCPNSSPYGGFPTGTGQVLLDASNFPNPAAVSQAGQAWNIAQFGYRPGVWPSFQTSGSQTQVLRIIYRPGYAVDDQGQRIILDANGTSAVASYNPYTSVITVWGQYTESDGVNKANDMSDTTFNTTVLEHELGHPLGLGDDSCVGGIMGPWDGISATVITDAEKFECDDQNLTHQEQIDGKNDQCPPDNTYCQGSPIVINLMAEPYELTDRGHGVVFRLDPAHEPSRMSWTAARTEQAFLWLDRNGNGVVDDGGELLGNFTRLRDGSLAMNGFEALREFDINGDGVIDEHDPIWFDLRLWVDRNHNGIAEPEELSFLSDSQVTSIGLSYRWSGRRDRFGNMFRYEAQVRIARPRGPDISRPLYDIYFLRFGT